MKNPNSIFGSFALMFVSLLSLAPSVSLADYCSGYNYGSSNNVSCTDSYGNTCSSGSCYDYKTGQHYTQGSAPPCPLPSLRLILPADGQIVSGQIPITLDLSDGTLKDVTINSKTGYVIDVAGNRFSRSGTRYTFIWDTTAGPNASDYYIDAYASNSCGTSRGEHQIAVQNIPPALVQLQAQRDAFVFEPNWYLQHYPDLAAAFGGNLEAAAAHWINFGINEGRQGSAYFSPAEYLRGYSDLAQAFGQNYQAAINHYLAFGRAEGRAGVLLAMPAVFDAAWYLSTYPDLSQAFQTDAGAAMRHWINFGINEGRQGSPDFSPSAYLARYSDLAGAFGSNNYREAARHYIYFGQAEGRNGKP